MKPEIERKFLVKGNSWKKGVKGFLCRQGYIRKSKRCVVRVRTIEDKAYLSIKGGTIGITRMEYEYEIPVLEANDMLDHYCEKTIIEKIRYLIPYKGMMWEVDEFYQENEGLVIAEIELKHETQAFEKPDWIGEEVTGDARYYNSNLARYPYRKWLKTNRQKREK